jgi:hypothetical protein
MAEKTKLTIKLFKNILFSVIVLVSGFINAFLTAGVHSLFFMMMPLLAFVFGFLFTWKRGLFHGFLLFAGYTFAISIIWWGIDSPNLLYPLPYIYSFIAGGFGILLIGALAPMIRKGIKRPGAIAALVILAGMTGWCGYSAMPRYSYYFQAAIQSPENIKNLDIYLPAGNVSGKPYEQLYSHVYEMPGHLTEDFTWEIVDTEHGRMLKVTIPELKKDDVPVPRYTANIIWQSSAPQELIRLMPRYNTVQVGTVTSQRAIGPVKGHESILVERFNVPIKVIADSQAPVKLTLWNRTDRSDGVNFAYHRSYPYTEHIDFGDIEDENSNLTSSDRWIFVPVESTVVMSIRGISD